VRARRSGVTGAGTSTLSSSIVRATW